MSKPVPPQLKPFTTETARLNAKKRWAMGYYRKPPKPVATPQTSAMATQDAFCSSALASVREDYQLTRKRYNEEVAKDDCDGQRLNWLAQALSRLEEQEQKLSQRPSPARARLSSARRTWSASAVSIDPTPAA